MTKSRSLWAVIREGVPTVALVAVCLAFFLGIVRLSFPEGTSLRGMIRADEGSARAAEDGPRLETVGLSERRAEAARLTRVVRKVKDKPADDIAWHDARPGMPLGTRHSIQTLAQSSATIDFDDETSLVLGENSLIVLRSFDGEEDGSDRRATLVVFGGELRATVGGGGKAATRLAVETPRGVARVASGGGGRPASFRVKVKKDSSATVAVLDGEAEIRLGARTVRVEANEAVDVDVTGHEVRRKLPVPPALLGPDPERTVPFRGTAAPEIRFLWSAPANGDAARFVLARDPDLADVAFQTVTPRGGAAVGALPAGRYWWSVATVHDGIEGNPAPPRALTLLRDEEAPALAVQWPEGVVHAKAVHLTGVTEPGAHLFAGDTPGSSGPDGRFEIEVPLTRGANNVVVESVDDAGNSAYASRLINALY